MRGDWRVAGYREVAHFVPEQPQWMQRTRSSLCGRANPPIGLAWEESTTERHCAPCTARLALAGNTEGAGQ